MISVEVYKKNGRYQKIICSGHALYADYGKDIVCASVSVLIINCFNSIEKFTDDFISSGTENGETYLNLKDNCSKDAELLIDSLLLGLQEIKEQYGKKYLKISVKEV